MLSGMLPEGLRTRTCYDKRAATTLSFTPGQPVTSHLVEVAPIDQHFELYRRIRADFCTIAQVSIYDTDWFALQDAEDLMDKLQGYLYQRFDNRFAPVSFYVRAFVKTMGVFVEAVTTYQKKLSQAVADVSSWQHYWSVYNPGSAQSGQSGTAKPARTPDLPKQLEDGFSENERLRRQLQSEKDKRRAGEQKSWGNSAEQKRTQSPNLYSGTSSRNTQWAGQQRGQRGGRNR